MSTDTYEVAMYMEYKGKNSYMTTWPQTDFYWINNEYQPTCNSDTWICNWVKAVRIVLLEQSNVPN